MLQTQLFNLNELKSKRVLTGHPHVRLIAIARSSSISPNSNFDSPRRVNGFDLFHVQVSFALRIISPTTLRAHRLYQRFIIRAASIINASQRAVCRPDPHPVQSEAP